MEKGKKVIEVSSVEELLGVVKARTAKYLKEQEEDFLMEEPPKEEDYEDQELFQLAQKLFMVSMVDEVKKVKKNAFTTILDVYNKFLSEKRNMEEACQREEIQADGKMYQSIQTIKNTGIVSFVLSFLFPQYAPIIIAVNLPRIGKAVIDKKIAKNRLERAIQGASVMGDAQNPLFDFTCDLREDYHKSNRELEELRKRAMMGENVIKELLPIISLERLNLQNVDLSILPNTQETDTKKVFQKKEDN